LNQSADAQDKLDTDFDKPLRRFWKFYFYQRDQSGHPAALFPVASALAVSMQTKSTLALTPALSPRRGRAFSPCWSRSPRGDLPKHRECLSPSLGERAGVRASLGPNCIVTAKVRAPRASKYRAHLLQFLPKKSSGMRFFISRDLLRRSLRNDSPASFATFRPKVDHPIRLGNQFQIVLDHDHRM